MEREGQADRIGAYRILKRLATGGTSDVLLAKAEGPHGFERTVVLKLLLSQFQNDPASARTFAREAGASARLSHPAIVRLFDFFSRPDGQLVMVLEFVDGPPLGRLRGMLKTVGKTLEDKPAMYVATRIFDGLAAAHAATDESGMPAPVIHRDVNPTNVLLPWDGQVKITDFGFAKVAGHASDTQIGILKGTYGYMAPEQVTGESVTVRADVYAAAIVLWELLTRRRAFQKGALPEVEALRAMAEPRLTSLDVLRPDLDKSVRQAMARALEPNAAKRTITAEEMVHVLSHAAPPEQGRDALVKTLALVRHDPPAVPTSYPPAPAETTEPSAPRPTPRASRLTPSAPLVRTAPFAVDRPGAPKVPQIRPISKSRPNTEDETQPVTSRGAAAAAEPAEPTSDPGTLPPQLQAPGLTLRQAIDEILRDVPTSLPPLFTEPTTRRSLNVVATAEATPPAKAEDPLHTMPTSRLDMPSSARTLVAEAPLAAETEPQPSAPASSSAQLSSGQPSSGAPSFGHTLVMGSPKVEGAGTAPMELPRSSPRLVGMEATPPPAPSVPPAPAPMAMTAAHGSQGAYPSAAPAPPPAPAPAYAPPALSAPPPSPSPPMPVAPPPARRGFGTVAVVAVVVMGLVAGAAGVLGLARSHRAKAFAEVSAKAKAPIAPLAPSATAPSARAAVDRVPTPSASPVAPSPPPPAASSSSTPAASAPSAVASASASSVASAAPSAKGSGGETGTMRTAGAVAGRRIFVDERVVGQTPDSVTIKCGTHAVRLGSAGRTRSVDIPCGGEITVGDR